MDNAHHAQDRGVLHKFSPWNKNVPTFFEGCSIECHLDFDRCVPLLHFSSKMRPQ